MGHRQSDRSNTELPHHHGHDENQGHSPEHAHTEHTHHHVHAHDTDNTHAHQHGINSAASQDEAISLLKYMLNHNRHHTKEIAELSFANTAEVTSYLDQAIEAYGKGNEMLAIYIAKLEEDSSCV